MINNKETLDMNHYVYYVEMWENGEMLDRQSVNEYCANDAEFKAVMKKWSDEGYVYVKADHNIEEPKLELAVDFYEDDDECAESMDDIEVPYSSTIKDAVRAIAKALKCKQKDIYVNDYAKSEFKKQLKDLSEVVFSVKAGKDAYEVEYL